MDTLNNPAVWAGKDQSDVIDKVNGHVCCHAALGSCVHLHAPHFCGVFLRRNRGTQTWQKHTHRLIAFLSNWLFV